MYIYVCIYIYVYICIYIYTYIYICDYRHTDFRKHVYIKEEPFQNRHSSPYRSFLYKKASPFSLEKYA